MSGISDEAFQARRETFEGRSRLRRVGWFAVALLGLGGLFAAGYLPKLHARERLIASTAVPGVRTVRLIEPKPTPVQRALRMSATLIPFEQTALHARANGYVRRWLVDLGTQVKAGQLLAEIDTPELDRELEQAHSQLAQSEAGLTLAHAERDFAQATLQRFRELAANKLTSKQELERTQADANVAEARVQVAEAARLSLRSSSDRLAQLKAFARVVAPFAGTITARQVERGALVAAGGTPLFELSRVDPLRITADVPQSWALGVQQGLEAKLSVAEYPTRQFAARVARSAGRLEPSSRTLHVELEVPNPKGELLPGMYGTIELTLAGSHPTFTIPSSALILGSEGTRVAVVDDANRVQLRAVLVERDNGAEVELASGLSATDHVVVNPSSGLHDGTQVKPTR
jgi:RND family efflux transporter MFP subunit